MPSYKTHVIGGVASFIFLHLVATKLFAYVQPTPKNFAVAFIACVAGSLFPDIDTKSVGQRIFYSLMTIPIAYAILSQHWKMLAGLSIISLFPLLSNHRGVTHTLWFITLVPPMMTFWLVGAYPSLTKTLWVGCVYFIIGAFSHLVLDLGFIRSLKKWR